MGRLSIAGVEAIRRLVDDLVAGNYAAIEEDGRTGRLTLDELKDAIADYGRTLVSLPREGWDLLVEYPKSHNLDEVRVDLPLWTSEEGRSDLTLQLTVVDAPGRPTVSIDDLHVL